MRRVQRAIILTTILLTACLSTRIGTGHARHERYLRIYVAKCLSVGVDVTAADGTVLHGGLPAGTPVPAWCPEAGASLNALREANQEAQGALPIRGSKKGVRAALDAAIARADSIFQGR